MAERQRTDQELAVVALEQALAAGAAEARVVLQRQRRVELEAREGKLDKLEEATRARLVLALYVEGRYSVHETSDLRQEALARFIADAVAVTRLLGPDPQRGLPPAELCRDYPTQALDSFDAAVAGLSAETRRERVLGLEQLARQEGGRTVLTASACWQDSTSTTWLVQSNGASGEQRRSEVWTSADITVSDPGGRRPEGSWYAGATHLDGLPPDRQLAAEAARRALQQVGARPVATARVPVLIEAVALGTLLTHLLRALDGQQVQQERSFLGGLQGRRVAAAALSLRDEPLFQRGLGSRHFDGEGMAARPFALIERGMLRDFYLDTTYARKLSLPPTTAGASNLLLVPGDRTPARLLAELGDGVLITSFLGGNANGTTGDFSLGFSGQRVVAGRAVEPLAASNLSGNLLELWQSVVAIGDDLFRSSTLLRPSVLFAPQQVSGA